MIVNRTEANFVIKTQKKKLNTRIVISGVILTLIVAACAVIFLPKVLTSLNRNWAYCISKDGKSACIIINGSKFTASDGVLVDYCKGTTGSITNDKFKIESVEAQSEDSWSCSKKDAEKAIGSEKSFIWKDDNTILYNSIEFKKSAATSTDSSDKNTKSSDSKQSTITEIKRYECKDKGGDVIETVEKAYYSTDFNKNGIADDRNESNDLVKCKYTK